MFVTAFRCVSCKGVFTFINIFMVTLDTGFVFFFTFSAVDFFEAVEYFTIL